MEIALDKVWTQHWARISTRRLTVGQVARTGGHVIDTPCTPFLLAAVSADAQPPPPASHANDAE